MSGIKDSSKAFKIGSIIYSETFTDQTLQHIQSIGVVTEVKGNELYISHVMTSLDGEPWEDIRQWYSDYEGEYAENCRLITAEEFDLLLKIGIIPRESIKNVKLK